MIRTIVIAAATAAAAPAFTEAPAGGALRRIEPIAIEKAIRTAEAELGGVAVEAELDMQRGRLVYDVDVAEGRSTRRATIDAETGELLSTSRGGLDLFGAKPSIGFGSTSALVAEVERQTGGKVRSVGTEESGGRVFVEMEVALPSGSRDVLVDPDSGTIILDETD